MDIGKYIEEIKSIQTNILDFIDKEDNSESDYKSITKLLLIYKNPSKKQELKYIFYLLRTISNDHHHSPNFSFKIEQILLFFQEEIKQTFSNFEIFDFFKDSKRILLFLLENKIVTLDKSIAEIIYSKPFKKFNYRTYFSPELEKWKSESPDNEIAEEKHIHYWKQQKFKHQKKREVEEEAEKIELDSKIEELRRNGENESAIGQLIRNDSIKEFIIYATRNNYKLTNKSKKSYYETNSLLNEEEEVTLIEYATFFGSIQIFHYLRLNGVELTPSLWIYAVHSNNAEMIHVLEEFGISPIDKSFQKCLKESIKCHHNDIFNYIINNHIDTVDNDAIINNCLYFRNFVCLPDDFYKHKSAFFYACKYDYLELVKLFLKEDKSLLNEKYIFHTIYNF